MAALGLLLYAKMEINSAVEIHNQPMQDVVDSTTLLENGTKPFHNPKAEIVGCIILFTFIALSNAGGLSGAGSIIPIMLIFYDLHMFEAVPVSAFVAVCATCFRFLINFNQMHPNAPKRVAINYEVVEITMPFVFLGSFYGVQLGHMVGEIV